MARQYDTIEEHLADWIARQPLFFVGSAPLAQDGHVNISPKATACRSCSARVSGRAGDLSAQKRLRTQGREGYAEFVAKRNASSLDGLPAVDAP